MVKKMLSIIMTLVLAICINGNVFAEQAPDDAAELKQAQDNKENLQKKVQSLNSQINDILKSVNKNKNDMNKINQDMKNVQAKSKLIQSNSKAEKELLQTRVRAMYISGTGSYLQVILGSHGLNDLLSRMEAVSRVIKLDNKIISDLDNQKEAVEGQKKKLYYENSKLADLRSKNETTLLSLNKDIKEQNELLSKATEKEEALKAAQEEKSLALNSNVASSNLTLSRGGLGSFSYSKVINVNATAYSGDAYTAIGYKTKRDVNGYSTIAVDPRVIPLYSKVYVEGYGYAIASDIGSAIVGNRIDVFLPTNAQAESWGVRAVKVYILN